MKPMRSCVAAASRPPVASIRPCRCHVRLSRTWHKRHVDDPYVRKAIAEGYRSRAAFKLIELDAKIKSPKLLRNGTLALELGAAPGSWTQVLVAPRWSKCVYPTSSGFDFGSSCNLRRIFLSHNTFRDTGGKKMFVLVSIFALF